MCMYVCEGALTSSILLPSSTLHGTRAGIVGGEGREQGQGQGFGLGVFDTLDHFSLSSFQIGCKDHHPFFESEVCLSLFSQPIPM